MVFLGDYVRTEGGVFEEEDDRVAADGAAVVGFDLRDVFQTQLGLELHVVADFYDWIFVEYVISYF